MRLLASCVVSVSAVVVCSSYLLLPPGQVVRGMMGANKELEAKIEEVLNTRGFSLYNGLSEVMDT